MILKELNLIGFGKFKNKTIKLEEGLNIIYGENEAGKSTIHSFIEGMFFGFLRPNVKSALYNEEHSKYDPWNKGRYAGIIRFEYENKDYRIERDFTKGNEDTKVFDEMTGKEISKSIEKGRTRISQPGVHFFGLNTRVFSNTVFIKQLQSVTDRELANDVREKLINVNTSLDDSISIDKAILDIDQYISNIGSEKAYTKPYASNLKEIEELENERKNIEINKKDYEEYLEERSNLETRINMAKKSLSILKTDLNKVEILEKKKVLKEAKDIIEEIENLKSKKEGLESFANISMKDYEKAIKLKGNIDNSSENIKNMGLELEDITRKIKTFDPDKGELENQKKLEILNEDYYLYEEYEKEEYEIKYNKDKSSKSFLQRDKKSNEDKEVRYKKLTFIFILISLIIDFVLYLNKVSTMILFIPMFIIGIIVIYSIIEEKKIHIEKDKIIDELEKKISQENLNNDRIEEIKKIYKDLLDKHKVKTKLELKNLIDNLQIEIYSKSVEERQYNELKRKKSTLEDKIEKNKESMNINKKILDEIFSNNKCKDLREFSLGLDNKKIYEESIEEIDHKGQLLEKVLGNYTIEELSIETNNKDLDMAYILETNKETIMDEIDNKKNEISKFISDLRTIEEKIRRLDEQVSRIVEIEEETHKKIEYKKILDDKLLALNLAKSTIKQLSEEIHTEFAPSINKKLSKIVEKITSGKYNKVRVSEDLDINLENPNTDEIINIEGLSGGTIDQLYFALRFGIIDEITEKILPLFLDDCFIQYDEKRLKNVLEYLTNNIIDRQVLLFTCHKREKKVLEELGIKFNSISLT